MDPTSDCSGSATRLSDLIEELQAHVATGAAQEAYELRIHDAAARVHAALSEAIAKGWEVRAHKGNGRVLTMHTVGPIRRTRFKYGMGFERSVELLDDECELVSITRFEVAAWP